MHVQIVNNGIVCGLCHQHMINVFEWDDNHKMIHLIVCTNSDCEVQDKKFHAPSVPVEEMKDEGQVETT